MLISKCTKKYAITLERTPKYNLDAIIFEGQRHREQY